MLKFNPITGQFDLVGTSSSGGGIGGTTGTTDNAITRADGTGGSTLQAGGTNPPTYDDAGNLSAIALILPATGSASATTLQFAGAANTGIFQRAGGYIMFASVGSEIVYTYPGGLATGGSIGFSGGSLDTFGPDTFIVRDAANILALRNGANAQTLNVYNTFTDASNYERFTINWNGGTCFLGMDNLGTGSPRQIVLNTSAGVVYRGPFLAFTDNTYDIGASGASRPRTIYAATSVLAPNIPVVDTGWTANADGGSKSAVIPSSATLATLQTAMNLAVAGSGDALAAGLAKIKAIEAALVALLLPNA